MTTAVDTPRVTKASLALHRKFQSRHGYAAQVARRTEIPAPRLCRIAKGEAFPRADEGARLVKEGIPIGWWCVLVSPGARVKRPRQAA